MANEPERETSECFDTIQLLHWLGILTEDQYWNERLYRAGVIDANTYWRGRLFDDDNQESR